MSDGPLDPSAHDGGALADGLYDVFVFGADDLDEGGLRLTVTILSGEHKGEVVALTAVGLGVDEIDAIGMPGTLEVHEGSPSFQFDEL